MSIPKFTLKTSNTSSCNYIGILDCLKPAIDIASPKRHHEDLRVKLIGKDTPEKIEENLQFITCGNKQDFLSCFKILMQRFNVPGFKPIILIHAHGDKEHGLQLPDHSFVTWPELIELFDGLTKRCNGDCTIISGFCHSFELIKHIPKNVKKLPFAFYYGYTSTISAGIVEDEMSTIFNSFIDNGGEYLFNLHPKLRIRSFGEFDFIMQFLAPALAMAADPKELSKLAPQYSQERIRESVRRGHNGPQGGLDKIIKSFVRNDGLAVNLIETYMHDTERKEYVLKAVDDYFSLIKNGHD
ncbi:hypothetical protein [Klebsiella variicola]|uniref:hypothetical protein n=1 Tax=Klebsiella variicola TaxID=244366 RepID=UPI002B05C1DB|nr:hypothetical protein [Klebsiella variicola]